MVPHAWRTSNTYQSCSLWFEPGLELTIYSTRDRQLTTSMQYSKLHYLATVNHLKHEDVITLWVDLNLFYCS